MSELDELIDSYRREAAAARDRYRAGQGDRGEWRYLAGLVEGLRIARRTELHKAAAAEADKLLAGAQ